MNNETQSFNSVYHKLGIMTRTTKGVHLIYILYALKFKEFEKPLMVFDEVITRTNSFYELEFYRS